LKREKTGEIDSNSNDRTKKGQEAEVPNNNDSKKGNPKKVAREKPDLTT